MSASKTIMDLKTAMQYMDPMQVTDYLHKTLDFLKRNNTELCFPNISQYTEAFLVNLVTDTRNLKCKSFKNEDKRLADEIIEVLELSRDVFRWAYSYENRNKNKNLLVYKKIYTNKIKDKKKNTMKLGSMSHRLIQAQNQTDTLSTAFKLSFLNKTLRFIKNNDEVTLYYNELPLAHAEYVQSLMQSPVGNDVGFGFKSLYAPLWEAMEEQSVNFVLKMTLQATIDANIATLKLEKIPRKNNDVSIKVKEIPESTKNHIINVNETHEKEEASRKRTSRRKDDIKPAEDNSLNTNTCATSFLRSTFTNDPKFQLLSQVSSEFIKDTVINLAQFATEPSRASISFNGLTEHELSFVKRVKGWAASPEERNKFSSYFRDLLIMLNANIAQALKTCKITSINNEKDKGITLKKTPLFAAPLPVKQSPVSAGTRSKSLGATKSRDRSVSKDRLIQFQTASPTTKTDSTKDKENIPVNKPVERGRSTERRGLNKRTAKLLEDMSTPVESDRGMRMMLLMGWAGGALGSRGEGIIEPIIPAVDLPPKAGLGHVPPPKVYQRRPVEFRMTLLHSMYDLLLHDEIKKEILYKEPLTKKEKKFIPAAVQCFNGRRPAGLWGDEADIQRLVLQELCQRPHVDVRVEISQDFKTVTLIKVKNAVPWGPTIKQAKKQKQKKPKENAVQTVTDEDTDVLVTSYDIETEMQNIDRSTLDYPDSKKAIRKRALRILFLKKITEVMQWETEAEDIRFKSKFTMQKTLIAFIRTVVASLNGGVRYSTNNLFGFEHRLYEDLRRLARPWQLSVEFKGLSRFTLTKKPIFKEDNIYGSVGPKVCENNNDVNKVIHAIKDNLIEVNTKEKGINKVTKEIGRNNIDNNENVRQNNKCNENILTENNVNIEFKSNGSIEYNTANVRDLARNNNDNLIKSSGKIMEEVQVKMEPESDNIVPYDTENDVVLNIKQEIDTFADNVSVLDNAGLSDLDKDIQDLEMSICNADIAFNVKKEEADYNQSDLELALNTELSCDVNKENGTDTLSDFDMVIPEAALCFNVNTEDCIDTSAGSKRSRTNLNSSQELDPKRSKISTDDSELIVIISPKNPNEKINSAIIRDVQSVISDEIDKCSEFLPLLKCHGVQNGGLVYSCHDNDDVAWLENLISVANLDLEIVSADGSCLEKNRCIMAMKINSFWILEKQKTFSLLEKYNVGLETKSWKVLCTQMVSKPMRNTCYIFIVQVDEKSLKYISEENFSLYCGIDKAEFSIMR